jgi:hypothetical protein
MSDRGSFHYRNLETCKELQVAYKLLLDLKRHTSRSIREATGCECGAHTVISELRANIEKDGYGIEQEYDGKTADGNRVSWYKLITTKKEVPNVPDEIRKLYSDCKKAAASFSGIEASNGHVEKIQLQISDLVNRFSGLKEIT